MRKPGILLLLVATFFCSRFVSAQAVSRYNTFSYGVNEGLLQTTLGHIEIDKNNYCWITFPNGIQKFDGNSFTNVPVQPGLPDDKYVRLFRCKSGDLLFSHSQGISKYDIETDKFSLFYKQPATNQRGPIFIGEESGIFYCYEESGIITAFDCKTLKSLSFFKTNLFSNNSIAEERLQFSDNIINNKVALKIDATVYLVDLKEKRILNQKRIEALLHSYMLRLKTEYEVLYYDQMFRNTLQCWNFQTNTNLSLPVQGKDDTRFSRCVIFPWQNKMLISFSNRLFEADSTLRILKSELVNFQNQPVTGNAAITTIKEDNFGNLYLQTVTGGIRKVIRNNYPIKYFGKTEQTNNNTLAIFPDKKNNRILVGGNGGLFVYDTLQQLIKHIPVAPGNHSSIVNGIIQSGDGDYMVFVTGSKIAYRLDKDLSISGAISISSTLPAIRSYTEYFGNPISNNGKSAVFQTQEKLYRVDFTSSKIFEYQFSGAYILGGFWYNNMIISHGQNELIFLDGKTFKELKKISFKEPAGVRCFAGDHNGGLYAGGNKGIFKIDTNGKILIQWNKSTGLPDECIYAIAFDKEHAMWCSTNKGILRIDKDNNLLQLSKQDGLQENEFNSNVVAITDDGEFYFGGINGVSSFYPSAINSFEEKLNVLLTGLKVNNEDIYQDKAIYNIRKIALPFGQNSLSFDFIAMGNYNPGQYIYQYRIKETDKEWIQNNGLQTVRYSLSPGKYTLQLYASRQFDKDAMPMKELTIVINPPFWKTWWFRTLLAIVVISILYYIINQRNKTKYAAKLQQLEHERKIKEERERISKDLHDSLGAYANAVLYNSELLEKEDSDEKRKDLIGDLKFASKDIITSLRETVWALKKEQYTAEDCLVRIRNFVQPLTRYYQHINFSIEGDAPPNRILHYTKALNVVRIVQEGIANSIKHSGAKNINIKSTTAGNKWNLIVEDDGTGFNVNELKDSEKGNGLNNMEHRAAEAGFVFSVNSTMNDGTTIKITI